MRSALVRWQLVAFALVAIVGLLYVGAKYVRLDNLLGFGQYTVQADFADSGGIFTNAEVSYRGVPVGTVGDLHLTDDGVLVDLKINTSAPEIPSSAKAVVANRSAIGEQYVDLQPSSDEGPYLEDGSLIVRQDTATPVPVEEVLASTNALVRSVPLKALNTTVTELGKAFNGKGDDLQVLVDSLNTLSQEGIDNLPQTLTLIRDTRTVLDTQSEQSSAIRQFSSDLDLVAAQLRASDPDLRRLIETGTAASNEVGSLIDSAGAGPDHRPGQPGAGDGGPRSADLALNALLMFLPATGGGSEHRGTRRRHSAPGPFAGDQQPAAVHPGLRGDARDPRADEAGEPRLRPDPRRVPAEHAGQLHHAAGQRHRRA